MKNLGTNQNRTDQNMKNGKLPISVILNHEKSSGSMEAARAVEIFQHEHSVQKHKLV